MKLLDMYGVMVMLMQYIYDLEIRANQSKNHNWIFLRTFCSPILCLMQHKSHRYSHVSNAAHAPIQNYDEP